MWTSSSCIKQVRGSLLSCLGIKFQTLNLQHFDQIIGLKSLSIYLFLLARLNLGPQIDRLPVQASQMALSSERERGREKEGCLNGVGTYLPGTVMQAVYVVSESTCPDCVAGVQVV